MSGHNIKWSSVWQFLLQHSELGFWSTLASFLSSELLGFYYGHFNKLFSFACGAGYIKMHEFFCLVLPIIFLYLKCPLNIFNENMASLLPLPYKAICNGVQQFQPINLRRKQTLTVTILISQSTHCVSDNKLPD